MSRGQGPVGAFMSSDRPTRLVDIELRAFAGLALYLLPGLVWAWALVPRAGWAARLGLAVLAAVALQTLALMSLNLFFGVPLRIGTFAHLSVLLALAGLAVRVTGPLQNAVAG